MARRFRILSKEKLAPDIKRYVVSAPLIAKKAQTGQFVILRVDETGERFPLTLVDWDPEEGTIILIFQEVGVSTKKLGKLRVGDYIEDMVGPLGNPTEIEKYGEVVVIGGGVGTALIYPWIRALKEAGNRVVTILGGRTANLLLLEDDLRALSDELHITTNDGSKGVKGFTTHVLSSFLEKGRKVDLALAAGPVPMMRAVAEVTRPYRLKTVVSLNPIMVDGTGMCGGCRVTVGGETKFACVDGPEFDAHKVDFRELMNRLGTYLAEETRATAILKSDNA
jgi:NAD(P)H-flavin reductase